jgi:hypothetical protein
MRIAPKINMQPISYILLFSLFIACRSPAERQPSDSQNDRSTLDQTIANNKWIFDSVHEQSFIFKEGHSFQTNLFDLEYIGQLPNENKAPFLIFSGRDCNACDANIAIYIHSPSNGPMNIANDKNSYTYPGTLVNYEDKSPLQSSRAFFGQVLENVNGLIWYTKDETVKSKKSETTYLIRLSKGTVDDTLYNQHLGLENTLNLLKRGLCKEILGRDFSSEP